MDALYIIIIHLFIVKKDVQVNVSEEHVGINSVVYHPLVLN